MEDYKTLYQIAYIVQIVITCLVGWALIPLAWMIPMTIATKNAMNEATPHDHLVLGICVLIFQSLLSGILIIVATTTKTNKSDDENIQSA
ncbi:hypothetical protein [Spiroplasma endosymbiont of Labia minor]|uniref:hypothetical protein n=1 Tax=Spiroplasma endosymbiont of Labia minor TaxID=3066305 RepID=UPI0030D430B4